MAGFDTEFSADFAALDRYYRMDESTVVQQLMAVADQDAVDQDQVNERAVKLIRHIRSEAVGKIGVENIMHEYALTEPEGILLMCTAEALLRVPDAYTTDALIADKLSRGQWEEYVGKSETWLINASAWGLLLTGRVLKLGRDELENAKPGLGAAVRRTGEPLIRSAVKIAMQVMGKQFVLGETLSEALKKARQWESKGYQYSYDMLGEGARTQADADRYFTLYKEAIEAVGTNNSSAPEAAPGVSIKLSALHPRYQYSQRDRVFGELLPRVRELAELACQYNINLTIDAEEADRLALSLQILEQLMADESLDGWQGLGLAVQAYQRRAPVVINWLIDRAQFYKRRLMIRLVKGAYWDTEIKIAQVAGFTDFPVFTRKRSTDLCYRVCAARLLEAREWVYPQFATHNALTVSTILGLTDDHSGFEFQRLHGMGESLYEGLKAEGIYEGPTRIYAPVGEHESLLAYLVRRLLENGANTSFVNKIIDPSIAPEDLLEDALETLHNVTVIPHPRIRPPLSLYSDRNASLGLDLQSPEGEAFFHQGLTQAIERIPRIAASLGSGENTWSVECPSNRETLCTDINLWGNAEILNVLQRAKAAQLQWSKQTVEQRALALNRFAELMQLHKSELMGLCSLEAGKCAEDTNAEVREAIDFCRYYAEQARQHLATEEPLGTVLCISPWNFPLAIFVGQVVAALVTGNTVLAKPSEQTLLVAARAVELMHAAGIGPDVVILVPSDGMTAGRALLAQPDINGVMFTGSTQTAQYIHDTLVKRGGEMPVLVAETGGQNAMIVDSTALPEQVVDDVMASGFQSAGQRCSALRVLYVQDDIADKLTEMIIGAMQELRIGHANETNTDVGPVIDIKALGRLEAHTKFMAEGHGQLLYRCEVPERCKAGYYFPPTLYEIDNIQTLPGEVFGPVVHIVRFKAGQLDKVMADINSTGFGLTMGVHSRVKRHVDQVVATSSAGNIYVNRNMIGAVVGVQPFGGNGLSGTGPKAGGPDYLKRLVAYTPIARNPEPEHRSGPVADFDALRAHQTAWQASGFEERLNLIRHTFGEANARICADYAIQLCGPRLLQGPTGEDNSWQVVPRGLVWFDPAIALSTEALARLVAIAIVSGNLVITTSAMAKQIPQHSRLISAGVLAEHNFTDRKEHLSFFASQTVDVFVIPAETSGLLEETQHAKGPLPILLTVQEPRAAMLRFVKEVTVSNNTSAAGGNAKLMAEMD